MARLNLKSQLMLTRPPFTVDPKDYQQAGQTGTAAEAAALIEEALRDLIRVRDRAIPGNEVRYGTAEALVTLNRLADYDEPMREITYPVPAELPAELPALIQRLAELMPLVTVESRNLAVWSFDIDLTLSMPDDDPGCRGIIPVSELRGLQANGAVTGTCSDRTPSEQRSAMTELGFTPDFCIPKEMLGHLRRLMPHAELIHVGDDELRDRRAAHRSGCRHLWPSEF